MTEQEAATEAATTGLHAAYCAGVREVSFVEKLNGSLLMHVRYDLDEDPDVDAEPRALWTAVSAFEKLSESAVERVDTVAVYAYLQTPDGSEAVSTKVVMKMATVRALDWNEVDAESLPEHADQYKFNHYPSSEASR